MGGKAMNQDQEDLKKRLLEPLRKIKEHGLPVFKITTHANDSGIYRLPEEPLWDLVKIKGAN
jgi:O-acetyl-ADP-ribose deacetylase (regulator of RNase III)